MEPQVNWTQEETQELVAVWSEKKIQRGLEESFRNEVVYREVSGRLAAVGMSRSAKQCREKIKKLKFEYRKIKQHCEGSGGNITTFKWYEAMDAVMSERPATVDHTEQSGTVISELIIPDMETVPAGPTRCPTEDPQHPGLHFMELEDVDGPSTSFTASHTSVRDTSLCCWSKKEVQALLTLWANPAVQEELHLNVRNNKVYASLSVELALLGFNKAPKKCREKIKKLKQEYKRIKGGGSSRRASVWFAIMDEVLSSGGRCSETAEPSLPSEFQSAQDVGADDEIQWSPDEVQVLMILWAQPNVQNQLLTTATNFQMFMNLSRELTLVGFNKTPQQCSDKVNNLIEEYRKIKAVEPHREVGNNWYAILDSVLGPGGTSTEVDSAVLTQPESPEDEHGNVMLRASWTPDEIVVLLSRWAEESLQEQLQSTPRNERVFAKLSSELATDGFDKTTSQCRSKIKVLKRKYRRIKEQKDSKKQKSRWFAIMDRVLACRKPKAEIVQEAEVMDSAPAFLQQELSEPVKDLGCSLSLSSLCLLVPTLRLMCAFAWRVVQCCNVPQYGKVEELVRLVTELAPELLTPREKVQLLLRLRATMVLELCRSGSTANQQNIHPHLKVIQNLTMAGDQEELKELENSKSDFVESVHILLKDTEEERKMFFKHIFPIHYGQQYEATLHTLVWKFISRLDQLLPLPDIKQVYFSFAHTLQTAQWLSDAPPVMEECGRLVLKKEQLKALLHFHQHQTGSTNKEHAQTQNMFLPRLSLSNKALKQLVSEQQELSTGGADEGRFDYNEDDDTVKENQTDDSKGDESLKLHDEQSDDLTAADCSKSNKHLSSRPSCPFSDNQGSGLLQHISKVHLTQDSSPLHSKEPRTASALQKVHTEMCTPEMKSTANTCEYCAKVFKDPSALNSHRKTHTLFFGCDKCDKKYSSMASLKVHRRIHMGEPYLCSHCGRVFRTPYSLDFHVRIHTGDRRYKCPICGKTSIQHLTRHMQMHRGEKNYLCTECGKAFLSSGELRLHMRYHTGERPYTCKHCGRGFTAKCLLTVHMRQHTGESPYRCPVCPKSFQTLKAQKRHVTIHSNKKSFQCLKCGKIFRQEDTLKLHVQTPNCK